MATDFPRGPDPFAPTLEVCPKCSAPVFPRGVCVAGFTCRLDSGSPLANERQTVRLADWDVLHRSLVEKRKARADSSRIRELACPFCDGPVDEFHRCVRRCAEAQSKGSAMQEQRPQLVAVPRRELSMEAEPDYAIVQLMGNTVQALNEWRDEADTKMGTIVRTMVSLKEHEERMARRRLIWMGAIVLVAALVGSLAGRALFAYQQGMGYWLAFG